MNGAAARAAGVGEGSRAEAGPDRHIICERDVGLFSLIQQVIANLPWALARRRVPIAYFTERTCYWTPKGYSGADTVWEYYFEPLVPEHPASSLPIEFRARIKERPPSADEPGFALDGRTFVSAHFGDHPALEGPTVPVPYLMEDPDPDLRRKLAPIVGRYIQPRAYLRAKVDAFFGRALEGRAPLVGVHARGTDAVSPQEVRPHRHGSLRLERFTATIDDLLGRWPAARLLLATDDAATLDTLRGR